MTISNEDTKKYIKSEVLAQKIIWAGMTVSMFATLAIVFIIDNKDFVMEDQVMVPKILAYFCSALLIISFLLFRRWTSKYILQVMLDKQDGDSHQKVRFLAEFLKARYMVLWAINETIVTVGLIHVLLFSKNKFVFFTYLAAGLILNTYMFPRLKTIIGMVRFKKLDGNI